MTDPISDLLARIRNAGQARHAELLCPSSKLKLAVAKVLVANGYLESVAVEAREGKPVLRIGLRYASDGRFLIDGLRRVSRPSLRRYVDVRHIPQVRAMPRISPRRRSNDTPFNTSRSARVACRSCTSRITSPG